MLAARTDAAMGLMLKMRASAQEEDANSLGEGEMHPLMTDVFICSALVFILKNNC